MLKDYYRATNYYMRVLRELVFPRRCAVCGNVIDTAYLCPACRKGYTLQKYVQLKPREEYLACLLYTSPSPRDQVLSRMPSSA